MRARCLAAALILVGALGGADARGQQGETAMDAGKHFRRGVDLYGEANYSGALVEFKRAYVLAPTSAALYDVGETEFQLQYYADALKTFRRFLAEYGPNEHHRADVENSIQVLASRVGVIRVRTVPEGADVALDDQAVGKTPLAEPLLASIGRRKVVASIPGRPPATQYIDLAAGDDVVVSLDLSPPPEALAVPPSREVPQLPPPAVAVRPDSSAMFRRVAWIAASSAGAAAITFGALAVWQADALAQARRGLTTSATLEHHANLATTFAVLADSLGAVALLTGGVTVYLTVQSSEARRRSTAGAGRVTIGPDSVFFETNF